jgi:serine/threonine protein kinase
MGTPPALPTSPAPPAEERPTLETASFLAPEEYSFLRAAQSPDELGRLGDYRILGVLGSGSMGIVFEAEDLRLHRRVALKVMKKAQAKQSAHRSRFLQEARSTAAIEHDHIVTIYQVGEDNGVPFLAMRLLVGESLEDRLNREAPLPPEEVIRIGREIAEGLAAAHERGLIHRDIKPANIWLEEGTDRVKIVDFGLARVVDDEAADEAERNLLIGTPLYMSPEQARGRELDPRSDLFGVGAVLYRAATGELPFKGRTIKAVIQAVLRETPESPRAVNPQVPPYLSRLIMDLLEKTPGDRPRSARMLIAALNEAEGRLDEVPPEPRREARREPIEEELEVEDDLEVEDEEPQVRSRPRKSRVPRPAAQAPPRKPRRKGESEYTLEGRVIWWSVFAGVCVFLLLAALVIRKLFFTRGEESSRRPPAPPAMALFGRVSHA